MFEKIPSLTFWKFLFWWVKILPYVSFKKVREGREESKVRGNVVNLKINCFVNASIPLIDLSKVLPCLHYYLDQLS